MRKVPGLTPCRIFTHQAMSGIFKSYFQGFPKDVMVMGYDAFHDTASDRQSVGAVISTTSPDFTECFSKVSRHDHREELEEKLYSITQGDL